MTDKNLPSPELLRKLLRYEPDTGKLYWRERTPDMFVDGKYAADRCCKIWNSKHSGKEAFTTLVAGYPSGRIFNCHYFAHRVIWAIFYGEWPSNNIDHINGDKIDNKIINLRDVEQKINIRNCKINKNNKSGVVGVFWYKPTRKWHSQITFNGIRKHLGYFTDKDDAIAARKAAEAKYGFHANHGRQT